VLDETYIRRARRRSRRAKSILTRLLRPSLWSHIRCARRMSRRAKSILTQLLRPGLWSCIRRARRTALQKYIATHTVVDNIVERTEAEADWHRHM
jgi:hypothetical protein